MRIAIDISVLQTDHRFRGIGSVAVNFINNISETSRKNDLFILFVNKINEDLAYSQLNLDKLNYEVRYLYNKTYFRWPGKLNLFAKAIHKAAGLIGYYTGDPRIAKNQLKDIDSFIQFDQNHKLPSKALKNTVIFMHDLIPYIMEPYYLWSYSTARLNGRSCKSSLKAAFKRKQYITKVRINCKRAQTIIAVSENTKADLIKYAGAKSNKINVVSLGASIDKKLPQDEKISLYDYETTAWGSTRSKINLTRKPFVLFVGGVDARRQIVELITAYNNLRARGVNLSLVLAGDCLDGLENIKNETLKKYLEDNTSYNNDIHLMGYITEEERNWLYSHALVFVFPSLYEGFGLPVLEAMGYGTPVITYKDTSIQEIGGDAAIYANNYASIAKSIQTVIDNPKLRQEISDKSLAQSRKFNWEKTTDQVINIIYQKH
jgi:glycosyltransferase involved in cell wall biosynthesis